MQNQSGTGPHAFSHDVFERETFCNNFYSTIFLQFFFFFTHSLNLIIIMVMCVQFITIVSLHIYSLLKIRLIFHPNKKKKKNLMKDVKKKGQMQNQSATWQDFMHSRMRSLRERHFVATFILQYSSNFFIFIFILLIS